MGDSYYLQQQYDDAMIWYGNAYENGQVRSQALSHIMAYIFDTKGNYSRAIDLYKEALSYDSTVIEITKRLGELLPGEDGRFYREQAIKLQQSN
jgi:tetratricopeptide (TPR) repeat protein